VPASYFPHAEGLSLPEGGDLLRGLLRDPRIRIIEVAEYASLRDVDRRSVGSLIDLLADSLTR
jgi:arginase family enzyme